MKRKQRRLTHKVDCIQHRKTEQDPILNFLNTLGVSEFETFMSFSQVTNIHAVTDEHIAAWRSRESSLHSKAMFLGMKALFED